MLSIMLFHFASDYASAIEKGKVILERTNLLGRMVAYYNKGFHSAGVEIFTFLSGMGLFYSMSKNSSIRRFYKNRLLKIVPAYCIVGAVFWIAKNVFLVGNGWRVAFKNFTFISFWTDGVHTLWYVAFILIMYLIYPVIFRLIDYDRAYGVVLILLAMICPMLLHMFDRAHYGNIQIAITRIPVFIAGSFLGYLIKTGKKISISASVVFIILGFVTKYITLKKDSISYLMRYGDSIEALSAIVLFVYLVIALYKIKCDFINRFFRFTGKYSLELYMIHVTLRNIMKELGFHAYSFYQYGIMIIISFVLAIILNKVIDLCICFIRERVVNDNKKTVEGI